MTEPVQGPHGGRDPRDGGSTQPPRPGTLAMLSAHELCPVLLVTLQDGRGGGRDKSLGGKTPQIPPARAVSRAGETRSTPCSSRLWAAGGPRDPRGRIREAGRQPHSGASIAIISAPRGGPFGRRRPRSHVWPRRSAPAGTIGNHPAPAPVSAAPECLVQAHLCITRSVRKGDSMKIPS